MLGAVILTLVSAEPLKLATTGFTCDGVSAALCEGYVDRFVSRLAGDGRIKVSTQRDIGAVLGIERQKQLLGCADEGSSSCMTELADALGVEGMLRATVAQTPDGFLVGVSLIHARDASAWLSTSQRVTDESQLQRFLDDTADDFRSRLRGVPTTLQALPWVTFGAGLALTVGGGICAGLAKADAALLRSTTPQTPGEVMATASRGATLQPLGAVLLSVGLAALVAGIVWLIAR